jgi:hypothetical protein
MNLREMQRFTMPSLPAPGDQQKVIITKANDALKELFKRDSDKEQRLRALEQVGRTGISLNTASQNFFPLNINYRTVTANAIILPSDIRVEVLTAGVTITLYNPTGNVGLNITIDNNTTGDIFVTSPFLIHGVVTQTLPSQNVMGIFCNGSTFRLGGI